MSGGRLPVCYLIEISLTHVVKSQHLLRLGLLGPYRNLHAQTVCALHVTYIWKLVVRNNVQLLRLYIQLGIWIRHGHESRYILYQRYIKSLYIHNVESRNRDAHTVLRNHLHITVSYLHSSTQTRISGVHHLLRHIKQSPVCQRPVYVAKALVPVIAILLTKIVKSLWLSGPQHVKFSLWFVCLWPLMFHNISITSVLP